MSVAGAASSGEQHGDRFWGLVLGSIGVVYGDIGTSPIYALREAVHAAHGQGISDNVVVLGVLSLIFWTLLLVVTLKYVLVLLRADNQGEGGTFALMVLGQQAAKNNTTLLLYLGIAGAAFFYGDAVITPAISVVSAIEGLKLVHPNFGHAVVPISVVILFLFFWMQSHGTETVSKLFGPLTLVWFMALIVGGFAHVFEDPSVFAALNPMVGIHLLASDAIIGLTVLGLVFLAVTGAEALYADLGHFGRRPIQAAWVLFVLPALVINYFGQGALILAHPEAIENSFFLLYPDWALIPMVALATMATIIASQAVISGAFSMTRQATQLGLLPRLRVRHTSESTSGQIYMPRVNWMIFVCVIFLVMSFRKSGNLAAAYGISVTATMVISTILAFFVVWKLWCWRVWAAAGLVGILLAVELVFFAANLVKFFDGGWLPLSLAGFMGFAMLTWRRGSRIVEEQTIKKGGDLEWLAGKLEQELPSRVPGTAVFLTATPSKAPTALLHNLKHNRVLHARNIILSIKTEDVPREPRHKRVSVEYVSKTFVRVTARYGFMETPNVPKIVDHCRRKDLDIDLGATSFIVSRRSLTPRGKKGMPLWQSGVYVALANMAEDVTTYYRIPTDRVVEIGTQVEI